MFYHLGASREAYEAVWTDASYAALTEQLARLPVHWRFFVKHRIFEALGDDPGREGLLDGSAVQQIFDTVVAEYPQLTEQLPS